MYKLSAISGATGEDLDALRDKAREMESKTKFSASEAADAMSYMAMAGWKTEDMLDGISGIMDLAAASGEDLATTSDIVTDVLTAFGLTAADSGHFADVLAAASSNANTNVAMMQTAQGKIQQSIIHIVWLSQISSLSKTYQGSHTAINGGGSLL